MLLVESDEKEREKMERILSLQNSQVYVIGVFSNGLEALEFVKKTQPDILIVAVRLQGVTGLEIAAYVRSHFKWIRVILTSAYDSIDFAMEAVDLKLDQFLLKPVTQTEFLDAVRASIDKIKTEERIRRETEEKQKEKTLSNSLVEFGLVYALLSGNLTELELEEYSSLISIPKTGMALTVELTGIYEKGGKRKFQSKRELQYVIKKRFYNVVNILVNPVTVAEVVCFVEREKEEYEQVIEWAKEMILLLRENYGIEARIGIGSFGPIEQMRKSYNEARTALRKKMSQKVAYFHKETLKNKPDNRFLLERENKIFQAVQSGKSEAEELFAEFLDTIRQYQEEERKGILAEVLIVAFYISQIHATEEKIYMNFDSMAEIFDNESWDKIERWAIWVFQKAMRNTHSGLAIDSEGIIYYAQKYMMDFYDQDVSMEDLSKQFGITPQYFSRLFKEKTGVNYVDWITRYRIEKAKELIRYMNVSIQEAGARVGFGDSNYFSKAFKQMEGITPREYAKL